MHGAVEVVGPRTSKRSDLCAIAIDLYIVEQGRTRLPVGSRLAVLPGTVGNDVDK